MQRMIDLMRFILAGVITAALGEFVYSVMLRGDWQNLLGSIFFNSLYLLGVYIFRQVLLRLVHRPLAANLLYYFFLGGAGLMVEWFMIGNSPWGNPQASQLGMFAYWTAMVMAPLLFTRQVVKTSHIRRAYLIYFVIFAAVLLGVGYAIPPGEWRYAAGVWLVIFGYAGMAVFWVRYFFLLGRIGVPLRKSSG